MAKELKEVEQEDSSPTVKLSEETLKKFEKLNEKLDAEEEEATYREPRKGDEGIDAETGEVLIEEKEEPAEKEEKPAEEEELIELEEKVKDTTPTGKEIALPNRLVQAGYRHGLTNDDIKVLGDRAEPVLTKMADDADKVSTILGEYGRREKAEKEEPVKYDEFKYQAKPSQEEDVYAAEDDDRFTKTEAAINELRKDLVTIKSAETKRQGERYDSTVNRFFDSKTKEYPEFGKTETLTLPELEVRKKIAEQSQFIEIGSQRMGRPVSTETALAQALSVFESTNIKQKVRTQLVKESEKRSKQLTSRPSHRRTEEHFKTPKERAQAKYAARAKELGISVSELNE